jgi:putative peptide zinc metalloprotease protein
VVGDWYTRLSKNTAADDLGENEGLWGSLKTRLDINAYCPKQHPEVIARRLDDRAEPYYVLKQGQQKKYMRLTQEQFNLWEKMDGETPVQELIVDHFMSTGKFAKKTIYHLLDDLTANRMLIEQPMAVWAAVQQQQASKKPLNRIASLASWVLTRRMGLNHLDGFFSWLYRRVGWIFFTRPMQVLYLIVSIGGLLAFGSILNNPDLQLISSNYIQSIILIWVATLGPVLIHELGHALTVKHYGREVPSGGFLLYFGFPAAFVETTDIWLEPRRARLAVTWNGPYTGLIIGGACALILYYFPTISFGSFLFKILAFAYYTVFINIIPLLKYDGYYLLSDALDIPYLRERSMQFLRQKLFHKIIRRDTFNRDEWMFTIYGVLSVIWMGFAMFMMAQFWQARIENGLRVILGARYSLMERVLSLLLIAAMFSFAVLLLLGAIRLVQVLLSRFVRSGRLARHGSLALIGVGFSLVFAAVSNYIDGWLVAAGVLALAGYTFYQFIPFTRPYAGSPRGWVFALGAGAVLSAGLAAAAVHFDVSAAIAPALGWLAVLLVLAADWLLIGPSFRFVGAAKLGLAVVVGGLAAWLLTLAPMESNGFLLPMAGGVIVLSGMLAYFSLLGGARAPAFALLNAGVLALLLFPTARLWVLDIHLLGGLLVVSGGMHLLFARLPDLTRQDVGDFSSHTQTTIGRSVPVLVRRIVSQVFFESGFSGVDALGEAFNRDMTASGLELAIDGNQFVDHELKRRTAAELPDIYGSAFDSLYRFLTRELGQESGRLTFGYGIDLLPWQNREIISEFILSRVQWGLSLKEEIAGQQESLRAFLKRVPLFRTCTDDELDIVAERLVPEQFAVGDVILTEGERGDKFYLVEKGRLSVWQQNDEQMDTLVDEKAGGQFFGELALVSDRPRNATVKAETPVSLLSLSHEDFHELVSQYISLAQHVMPLERKTLLLRSMPIFDEMESIELQWLTAQMEEEIFATGETVVQEGQPGDKFYIINRGQVRVTRIVNEQEVELSRLGAGEYFGEIALLESRPRTATVSALEHTDLFSLDGEIFLDTMNGYGHFSKYVKLSETRRLEVINKLDASFSKSGEPPQDIPGGGDSSPE